MPSFPAATISPDGVNATPKGTFLYQQDAPSCSDCGEIMVRNGACHKCPNCGRVQKLYVQVCRSCGEDLYLPDPSDVRHPALHR